MGALASWTCVTGLPSSQATIGTYCPSLTGRGRRSSGLPIRVAASPSTTGRSSHPGGSSWMKWKTIGNPNPARGKASVGKPGRGLCLRFSSGPSMRMPSLSGQYDRPGRLLPLRPRLRLGRGRLPVPSCLNSRSRPTVCLHAATGSAPADVGFTSTCCASHGTGSRPPASLSPPCAHQSAIHRAMVSLSGAAGRNPSFAQHRAPQPLRVLAPMPPKLLQAQTAHSTSSSSADGHTTSRAKPADRTMRAGASTVPGDLPWKGNRAYARGSGSPLLSLANGGSHSSSSLPSRGRGLYAAQG